jgi:hypothetical protein
VSVNPTNIRKRPWMKLRKNFDHGLIHVRLTAESTWSSHDSSNEARRAYLLPGSGRWRGQDPGFPTTSASAACPACSPLPVRAGHGLAEPRHPRDFCPGAWRRRSTPSTVQDGPSAGLRGPCGVTRFSCRSRVSSVAVRLPAPVPRAEGARRYFCILTFSRRISRLIRKSAGETACLQRRVAEFVGDCSPVAPARAAAAAIR